MKKKKLKKALKKAERLRDEWCAEYVILRDVLWSIRSKLRRLSDDGQDGADAAYH